MVSRSVASDLIWLSCDPASGEPLASDGFLDVATAGALIADLALRGRIDLVEDRIAVTDSSPTGVDVLDETLRMIADGKARTPEKWISALTPRAARLRTDVRADAVAAGILEHRTRKRLWLYTTHRWLLVAGRAADQLSREVAAVIGTPGASMPPHIGALIAVLDAAQVAVKRFPAADATQIEAAKAGSWADAAVRSATEQIQIAVMAAVMAATTAATTAAIVN